MSHWPGVAIFALACLRAGLPIALATTAVGTAWIIFFAAAV